MVIEPWKYGSKIKIKLGNQITKLQLPKKARSLRSQVQKSWESWFIGGLYIWMMVVLHGFIGFNRHNRRTRTPLNSQRGRTQGTSDRKGMRIQKNRTLANFCWEMSQKSKQKRSKKKAWNIFEASKSVRWFNQSRNIYQIFQHQYNPMSMIIYQDISGIYHSNQPIKKIFHLFNGHIL